MRGSVVSILRFCYDRVSNRVLEKVFYIRILRHFLIITMGEDKKDTLWYRLWGHRSLEDKRRLRSLVPYILYGIAVFYGIIYLSILNTVNRERTGTTVKTWFGGDKDEVIKARQREEKEIKESFNVLRRRVSGGR